LGVGIDRLFSFEIPCEKKLKKRRGGIYGKNIKFA